jgi:hypothetical protein
MTAQLRAENEADLALISDALHDAWFNAEKIRFDGASGELTIPFEKQLILPARGDREPGLFDRAVRRSILCFLRIRNVIEYSVSDTEKVTFYDLSNLHFDQKRREVQLETGIPIQVRIKVGSLCVHLDETDHVLEEREGLRIRFDFHSKPSKALGEVP